MFFHSLQQMAMCTCCLATTESRAFVHNVLLLPVGEQTVDPPPFTGQITCVRDLLPAEQVVDIFL
jgi:hypothetical protein